MILDVRTERRQLLGTRNLVGRSRRADLHLPDPAVSSEHASLWWDGSIWRLRDLASRNGTLVDGEPLPPGEGIALTEGAVLTFGSEGNRWRLVDARQPRAFARSPSGATVEATGELLVLPDEDSPLLTVYRDFEGRWVAERDDGTSEVHDLEALRAGSEQWRLHLPEPQPSTKQRLLQPTLETIALEFEVSRDLEHVRVVAVHGTTRLDLKDRAHHYPLFVLAQQRLRDQEAHPPLSSEAEGWTYVDEFKRLCDMDDARVNLLIFRARKQLASVGIDGAASIVERRASTRQLRIGVGRLSIRTL